MTENDPTLAEKVSAAVNQVIEEDQARRNVPDEETQPNSSRDDEIDDPDVESANVSDDDGDDEIDDASDPDADPKPAR